MQIFSLLDKGHGYYCFNCFRYYLKQKISNPKMYKPNLFVHVIYIFAEITKLSDSISVYLSLYVITLV